MLLTLTMTLSTRLCGLGVVIFIFSRFVYVLSRFG